jgi:hypothetical protein
MLLRALNCSEMSWGFVFINFSGFLLLAEKIKQKKALETTSS